MSTLHEYLDKEDAKQYRDLYIREQLVMAGGYMTYDDAVRALREFSDFTDYLLEKYEVDITEEWRIDIHAGAITYE